MFEAVHFNPPINEDDIEIAKQKLKDILGLSAEQNGFDDISSDSDNDEYEPDGKEYFAVEKVINRRFEDGEQKFEVKWKGYDDITWEPLENFVTQGSKMAIYLYFKGRWERKQERMAAKSQASGASTNLYLEKERMNRAFETADASVDPVKKNKESRLGKSSSAAQIVLDTTKKAIKKGHENSGPFKKDTVNVELLKTTAGKKENGKETKSNIFNMDTKKAHDVRSNQESDLKFKRSGGKRKAGIHNDSKNLKQFHSSSSTPKFARSSIDLKSKMDTQRREIKEYTERKKKEKAEEERIRREAEAQERLRLEAEAEEQRDFEEYQRMIQNLKNDLASSDDEEFCTEAN
uniref:Chromo domain-containing protein n=1 Tax=Panagrolaimus sp. PS1159 TaxID=55785 RepID=A0AC35F163_9BILA